MLWDSAKRSQIYPKSRFQLKTYGEFYNLAYASQNGDYLDRLRTKAEKLRMRLGGEACIDWEFPEKPKGMHWRTCGQLSEQGETLEERFDAGLAFHMARLARLFRKS